MRTRDAAIAGSVLLLAALGLRLTAHRSPAEPIAQGHEAAEPVARPDSPAPAHQAESLAVAAPAAIPPQLIADAYVEPEDVCVNEPATVHVATRDDRPGAAPVVTQVDHGMGDIVVKTYAQPGDYDVKVSASNIHRDRDQRTLKVHVHACDSSTRFVSVESKSVGGGDTYAFKAAAHFGAQAASDGAALSYSWDFGDGESAVSRDPYVEHDFSGRMEDSPVSSFLVRVTVTSAKHGVVNGLASVGLENLDYENQKNARVMTPSVVIAETHPVPSGYLGRVTFRNHSPKTLALKSAHVSMDACGSKDARPVEYEVPVGAITEVTSLAPGATSGAFSLTGSLASSDYCRAVVHFYGTTPEGMPVDALGGAVLKRTPSDVISAANAASDPKSQAKMARFEKALRLLGRSKQPGVSVTGDEMRQLQARGLLD